VLSLDLEIVSAAVKSESKFLNRLSWMRSMFVFDPLIYLYTVVLGTLSLVSSLFDRNGAIQHWFARAWSWLILKTAMCPVQVIGRERLLESNSGVYAVNHISAFDIPTLYVRLPFQFRIMAKKELFRYPFLGWHLRRSGQLPIDQQSPSASIRSLKGAVESLRSGMPLVIFPEGGRSATGQIQPFMTGAFYIAIKAQVDIIPLALVGTYEVLKMNTFHIHPGPIKLVVGEPISTVGYGLRDMDALAKNVQKAVEDLYYAHANIPDPRMAAASGR
jgi:1-acyl-sn-glycerol-3-phosphate acyltransferase